MKTIVFRHRYGMADHQVVREEFQFHKDAAKDEIDGVFVEWVVEQIGDDFTWYNKDDEVDG